MRQHFLHPLGRKFHDHRSLNFFFGTTAIFVVPPEPYSNPQLPFPDPRRERSGTLVKPLLGETGAYPVPIASQATRPSHARGLEKIGAPDRIPICDLRLRRAGDILNSAGMRAKPHHPLRLSVHGRVLPTPQHKSFPRFHGLAALLEQVCPVVCSLCRILDSVGEGALGQIPRVTVLGRPVPEG